VSAPNSDRPPYRYAERPPVAAIAQWVLSLWSFQSDTTPPADEPYTVWPDGCASVALARDAEGARCLAIGPRLTAMRPPIAAGLRLWGFRLWPDAIASVLGIPARDFRDRIDVAPASVLTRIGELDTVIPHTDDVDLGLGALNEHLSDRLADCPRPDLRIRAAVRAIVAARGEIAMVVVAREANLGLRQLQRRFPDATGLTLREYARIRRLREALARRLADGREGWSRVAAETGFVDHAHLTREFVALTGVQPSQVSRRLDATEHDAVAP
jgi:AraC-like DNA-binding protein